MNIELIHNCEVENVKMSDYPDFCDAYVSRAFIKTQNTSRELTEEELDKLNENGEFLYQKLNSYLNECLYYN